MPSDPDPLLNRLVVAALTIFIMVSLLLAAFVAREMWLQQRITGLSTSVQVNLDDLEETTEEIQSQLDEIRSATGDDQEAESTQLEDITELLEDVDAQLDTIEKEMGDVAQIVEPVSLDAPVETPVEPSGDADGPETEAPAPDRIDQVFTIFAALVGVAAIAIAVLLSMAVRVQQRVLWNEGRRV